MTITPDTKDWTWVLTRRCDDCGFDAQSIDSRRVGDLLRANAAEWTHFLSTGDPALSGRPSPAVWSPLEYGCHVRDVFRRFDERLALMLADDDPAFANWDQDATALADDYGAQAPATVAGEIAAAVDAVAARFDAVPPDAWARTGRRSDGARFTVDSLARYLLHDPIHHWYDVTGRRA
jgi:hypothetical protein